MLKFNHFISADNSQVELKFELAFNDKGELLIPLYLICEDLGIDYIRQKKALPVEGVKIGGKAVSYTHLTLPTKRIV